MNLWFCFPLQEYIISTVYNVKHSVYLYPFVHTLIGCESDCWYLIPFRVLLVFVFPRTGGKCVCLCLRSRIVSDFANLNVDDPECVCVCMRVCVRVCLSVCLSLASNSSEMVEIIIVKLGMVSA